MLGGEVYKTAGDPRIPGQELETTAQFLNRVRKLGIQLTAQGDRLACNAPKGALTAELKSELVRRKSAILKYVEAAKPDAALEPELKAVSGRTELPMSSGQKRLWFLEQLEKGNVAYNIPVAVELSGPLNVRVLEQSLVEIIRRHQSLRTRFVSVDGAPKAYASTVDDWRLEQVNLSGAEKSNKFGLISKIAREQARRPFDPNKGILVRGQLLEFSEGEHVLVLVVHHIAADGWGLGIIFQELLELYPAFLHGRPSPLPELPLQYADFADWQGQLLQTERLQGQVRYWKNHLQAPLPILELPSDRPRPSRQTFNGARRVFELSREIMSGVKAVSRAEGATDFIVLLSAFRLLLYRLTGQEDQIVGTAIARRNRPELEKLVGLFINNLALRTSLAGDPTVRELIGRVRETCLNGFANQDVPFDRLASVQTERHLSHSPLFQVMFILQNFPMPQKTMGELTLKPVLCIDAGTSRFDLTFELFETEDHRLQVHVEYNNDLFEEAAIEGWLRDYEYLLEMIVADPAQRISGLRAASPGEVVELMALNERTKAEYSRDCCIHRLFERVAAEGPDRPAVVCGSEVIRYGELSRLSNQIANRLRKLGVGPDSLVGICVERSVGMVAAMLGVLKAGGAYVPLDPHFPKERLAFMVEDSGMRVLLTDEQSHRALSLPAREVVSLESVLSESAVEPDEAAKPDNLAYVIYTSGSTGKPKGVQITHRSVVNFLESMRREPGLTAEDRLVSVTTLSFDIAGLEVFLPLTTGARTILAPPAVSLDGLALARLLVNADATFMQATPATWRLLLDSGWTGSKRLKVLCGGEAFPRELANWLVERCGEVWNLYGPTETTIWSTVGKVTAGHGSVPIGRAIANTQVYILDDHQRLVPRGVEGELYIGGDGLARGYLNRPDLTEAKFVPNPFEPGTRLYRTGDLARYLSSGELLFAGRNDYQVKLRGFRIELGEIESALRRCEGVADAVVVLREDTPGDQRLIAYVIPRPSADLVPEALRASLARVLPDYMSPSAFVLQDSFPLTPNRKIDRKALPPPNVAEVPRALEPPANEYQAGVADIWKELLRLPHVGMHHNFFDLGGHSLLLVQVQSRLQRRFGREIPVIELFQRPTVAGMADFFMTRRTWAMQA